MCTCSNHLREMVLTSTHNIRAWGYKTFFMLNSAENEICSAYEKLNTSNLNFLPAQQNWAWNFFLLINIKMPSTVGILISISRKNVMLNWVEYEKMFYNLGPSSQSEHHLRTWLYHWQVNLTDQTIKLITGMLITYKMSQNGFNGCPGNLYFKIAAKTKGGL